MVATQAKAKGKRSSKAVEFVHDALAIRTVNRDDRAYNDFQWPTEIGSVIECPDWDSAAKCGNGFHALLDGIGDWGLTYRDDGMIWQVVGVIRAECIAVGDDKVKFPRCVLLYRGDKAGALKLILPAMVKAIHDSADGKIATGNYGHAAATGHSGHAAATGYGGHAAATGHRGHAAATRHSGHAAATGHRGHAAATGNYGHAAATGDSGHAAATGYGGHAAATGYGGHAAATGNYGHAAATGDSGHAAATGYGGHAAATGHSGHAAATGYGGHAAATGYGGHAAVAGEHAIAASLGLYGTAKAEKGGAIMLAYYDTDVWPYALKRVGAFMVGQDGIEAGKTYRLNSDGKPEEVRL